MHEQPASCLLDCQPCVDGCGFCDECVYLKSEAADRFKVNVLPMLFPRGFGAKPSALSSS